MRLFISICLALVLALTSQSMVTARGAAAATGQMVLCTGAGPLAIYVDAQGQPTSAPHICPDAALNVVFETPSLGQLFALNAVQAIDWFPSSQITSDAFEVRSAQARAPPPLFD